jgi:ubiquinone/menaquinone biosynthesis C-methylase UbiE
MAVFDGLAETYDDQFTETHIGRWLRGRVHARLNLHWAAGDHVLELGCGTGEDARHLAAQGIQVTATDASEKMLNIARMKNQHTPLATFHHLDLANLSDDAFDNGTFSGAFSNFGVLNCLPEWESLAAWLAVRIKPGGKVGLGVMSPYCVWEMAWHGAHLHFRRATRRLRKGTKFSVEASRELTIHYPTPRRLTRDFSQWFKRTHIEGLGLFLPTSETFGVVEKRPRLLNVLTGLESRFAPLPSLAAFADHYWIEFERI